MNRTTQLGRAGRASAHSPLVHCNLLINLPCHPRRDCLSVRRTASLSVCLLMRSNGHYCVIALVRCQRRVKLLSGA